MKYKYPKTWNISNKITIELPAGYVEDGEEKKISVDLKFSEIYDADDPRAF